MIIQAIRKLPEFDKKTLLLVGVSPSSGALLRNYLKGELSGDLSAAVRLHSSLADALADVDSTKVIVLIDDNIASGTQINNQLSVWLSASSPPPIGSNYYRSPLDVAQVKKLQSANIAFAFAVANDQGPKPGTKLLAEHATKKGLQLDSSRIVFARSLHDWSGRDGAPKAITKQLREFLKEVGQGVISDRLQRQGKGNATKIAQDAEARALGYDGLEGLCVTAYNVPTSTYTAVWCPGTYKFRGAHLPWRPLFPRLGTVRDLILF